MKKVILAGISLCLPAVMLFAACGETKTTSENVSSEAPPTSSAAEQADVSSADIASASSEEIASVVSEAASSTATSSKNKVSSNPPASSKELSFVPDPKNPAFLSASQEDQIKNAWINSFIDSEADKTDIEVKILYYGTYHDCVALIISDNYNCYPTSLWDENIDGVIFHNLYNDGILIWNKGEFLNLKKVYEQGFLSQRDLKNIEYYFRTTK